MAKVFAALWAVACIGIGAHLLKVATLTESVPVRMCVPFFAALIVALAVGGAALIQHRHKNAARRVVIYSGMHEGIFVYSGALNTVLNTNLRTSQTEIDRLDEVFRISAVSDEIQAY